MRNLKRALSLGLTAAMVSGLMVMGSSAASYADVSSDNNQEAIDVLKAVGVMVGDDNGNFNPEQKVTRNEMAVVMSNLMDYTVASYKGTAPFTDVPAWAEAYVAACYTNGIIAGYSNTTFGGSDSVTTGQAALMLEKALGYFQSQSDFGDDWLVATTKKGAEISLFKNVSNGAREALTRNDLAQLVLNALKANVVDYTGGGTTVSGNGITIDTGKATYAARTSSDKKYGQINDERSSRNDSLYVVQLGEDLYDGDLKMNDDTTDDFMRPATEWKYGNTTIGTYTEKPDATYTARVNADDIYSVVGKSTADDLKNSGSGWKLYSYVDGVGGQVSASNAGSYVDKNNTTKINDSGNGMLTEVYMDTADKEVNIVSINTYVFQAVGDYSSSKDSITLTSAGDTSITLDSTTLDGDDFDIKDIKADDYILVTASKLSNNRYDVQSAVKAEVVTGSVDSYKVNDNVTLDGTSYKYSLTAKKSGDENASSDPVKSTQYTVGQEAAVVLDQYGYIIAVDAAVVSSNYVYVSEFARPSGLSNGKIVASAYFTDGTTADITVKDLLGSSSSSNMVTNGQTSDTSKAGWYTYSKNSSNEYSLYKVESKYTQALTGRYTYGTVMENDKVQFLKSSVGALNHTSLKANDKTVIVVNDKANNEVTAYTGVSNIPDIIINNGDGTATVSLLANASGYAYYVYVETTGNVSISGGATTELMYFVDLDGQHRGKDNEIYYTYTTLDGTSEKVVEADGMVNNLGSDNIYQAFYKTRTNSDSQLTNAQTVPARDGKFFSGSSTAAITYKDGALTLGGNGYTLASNSTIVLVAVGEDLNSNNVTAAALNKDKKADYEASIVTAKELADNTSGYNLVYHFEGKTTDNDGSVIEQLFVTVTEATPKTSGGGSGTITPPSSSNPIGAVVNPSAYTVTANVVYGTDDNSKRATLANAMSASGIDVTGITGSGNSYTLTTRDGRIFTGITNEYYTVTLDNTVIQYKAVPTSSGNVQNDKVVMSGYTTGSGYIVSTDGGKSYTYQTRNTPVPADTLNNNVVIKTGYVEVKNGNPAYAEYNKAYTVPGKGSNQGAGYSYVVGTTTKFVAYGGTIPAADMVGDITLTANQVTVTYNGFVSDESTKIVAYNGTVVIPAQGSNPGTGVKITGISGVSYKAYGDAGVYAIGNNVVVTAGYVALTAQDGTGVSAASVNVDCVPVTGGTTQATVTYSTNAVSTNPGTYVVKVSIGSVVLNTYEFTAQANGDLGNATIGVNVPASTSAVTLTVTCEATTAP